MAAVLKSDQLTSGSSPPQAVAFNMEDVQHRARNYLAEVQREAAELLAAARQEATRLREQAKHEGIAQAQQAIEQQIQSMAQQLSDKRCKTAIATCETATQQLAQQTAQWLAQWRDQTVELASRIAEKILRREMASSPETLRVWLEEALVAMRDVRELRVLVHPDDFAVAGRFLQQLTRSFPQAANVEVLPDPEISPGGCVVRSQHGQLDQQLESQLQRLVEQLR